MLSKEAIELLTRVGPGTPAAELLRRYWQLALLAAELLEPQGAPLRVRLLGEDLVAFRDTSGRPGLLGAHCPHRGASLFFGRNEEHGLRCVYHGWKFDVGGACVDMPSEPPESSFKDKIHHTASPCEERGGVIWVYLGPSRPAPPLPALEWIDLPPEQRFQAKRLQYCNWVQALRGRHDQTHVSFVHRQLNANGGARSARGDAAEGDDEAEASSRNSVTGRCRRGISSRVRRMPRPTSSI